MFRGIFPKLVLIALTVVLCSSETAWAQPGRGGRGGFFGGQSALGLLANEKVQKELELVDDQIEVIQSLQQEQRASMQEMFSGMRDRFRDMDPSERESVMGEIREEMQKSNKEFEGKAYEELLPHQVDRLKQLIFQAQSRRGGGIAGGQMSESLVEELGITDDQLEKMKEMAEKVREDLAKKMAKLRSQAEEEILSVLDPAQREKYKSLVGDTFEFDNGNARGGFGGRGGGRGGNRGGDQGGGRRGRGGGSDF